MAKIERPYCNNTMTVAARKSMVISWLRRGSQYWKPKALAKKRDRCGKVMNPVTGRMVIASQCAICHNAFMEKSMKLDHVDPCVDPNVGWVSFDEFIDRMLVEVDGYQSLCKPCHDQKTKEERAVAKERKDNG